MKVAVISPHLDDAVFSVAEHMLSRPDWEFTIITPCAGTPPDEAGEAKYLRLLAEHDEVCEAGGWEQRNGGFLDDVYPASEGGLNYSFPSWLQQVLQIEYAGRTVDWYDEWWVPMGIHHPDHLEVRRVVGRIGRPAARFLEYEELPYRVLYPFEVSRVDPMVLIGYDPSMLERKRELCRMYASQIGPEIERCLYVPERLWGPR